ncbi:MAG: TIGR04086 family membrane protein [Ruminococcus sp.]
MKKRCRRIKFSWKGSKCCCFLGAAAAGILVLLIFLSAFSLLISSFDASDDLISCMAAIALCAGSFTAGFIFARRRRRKGILCGLASGIFIYIIVFLFGIVLLKSFSGAGTFMKLILILLCSCIGGVCGVNTRICRPPK